MKRTETVYKKESDVPDTDKSTGEISDESPAKTLEKNGLTKNQWTILGGVAVFLLLFATLTLMVNSANVAKMESRTTSEYRTIMSECVNSAERDISERRTYVSRVDSEIIGYQWEQMKHDATKMSPRQVNDAYGGAHAFCVEVWSLAKHPTYYPHPIRLPYYPYDYALGSDSRAEHGNGVATPSVDVTGEWLHGMENTEDVFNDGARESEMERTPYDLNEQHENHPNMDGDVLISPHFNE